MDVVELPQALRISAIRLNVADIERAVAFYEEGLGFAVEKREEPVIAMSLGGERLELVQAPPAAAPYPTSRAANDPWFQHFAIRVSDMPAAYAQTDPAATDSDFDRRPTATSPKHRFSDRL